MNAKKCKALRKSCRNMYEDKNAIISFSERWFKDERGQTIFYRIVKPIFYPPMSRRRVYQDSKRFM